MQKIRNAVWELVEREHPNFDGQNSIWGVLYRYPIWRGVPSGTTVIDGWSQEHTAPDYDGTYTLYQYVQDGCLMGFRWEKEGPNAN